jgi:hypothetical protein
VLRALGGECLQTAGTFSESGRNARIAATFTARKSAQRDGCRCSLKSFTAEGAEGAEDILVDRS